MSCKEKLLVKGNEAIAIGAIDAGVECYFAYPITPQSDIPEYLSKELVKLGGEFIQAESEIASINMVLGAAACGKRAMTSSSSPGISLKQEGISYLAGSELPAVIINITRGVKSGLFHSSIFSALNIGSIFLYFKLLFAIAFGYILKYHEWCSIKDLGLAPHTQGASSWTIFTISLILLNLCGEFCMVFISLNSLSNFGF